MQLTKSREDAKAMKTFQAGLKTADGSLNISAPISERVTKSSFGVVAYLVVAANMNLDNENLHISVRETHGKDRLYIDGDLRSETLSVEIIS